MTLKKIIFQIDAALVKRAATTALSENRTLEAAFREWLENYARPPGSANPRAS